jgi:hypothetical protein
MFTADKSISYGENAVNNCSRLLLTSVKPTD